LVEKVLALINVPAARPTGDCSGSDSGSQTRSPQRIRHTRRPAISTFCRRRFHSPTSGKRQRERRYRRAEEYFGDAKVANFAVAGDTTQGVLWGLQKKNGEGQGGKTKAVML